MHNSDFSSIVESICAVSISQINDLPPEEAKAFILRECLKDVVVNFWKSDEGRTHYKIVKGAALLEAAANGGRDDYSLGVLPVSDGSIADKAAKAFGDLSQLSKAEKLTAQ